MTLSCSGPILICKQTGLWRLIYLFPEAWGVSKPRKKGKKIVNKSLERVKKKPWLLTFPPPLHPNPLGPASLLGPYERKCYNQKLKKLSQATLSDWVCTVLFWDPCNKGQSGLGTLSSFLNGWSKGSVLTDRAAQKQYLQNRSLQHGGAAVRQILDKRLPPGDWTTGTGADLFLSTCKKLTHRGVPRGSLVV